MGHRITGFRLNAFLAALLYVLIQSLSGQANAVETDCIEDGGLTQCTNATLNAWTYGACVNSNFNSTIYASGYCIPLNPGPWVTEGQMLGYVECMAKREFNACAATASLSGWASPGGTTTTSPCGTYTLITTNGVETRNFSYVRVDATYPAGNGTCTPGGYRTTVATRTRGWTCPDGYPAQVTVNGIVKCKSDRAPAPSCKRGCDVDNYGGAAIGNPIQVGSWEKYQAEVDYQSSVLHFIRTFYSNGGFSPNNGQSHLPLGLGKKWTHTYDRRIYPYPGNAYLMAVALRPDGSLRHFALNGREKLKLGPSALLEPQYSGGSLTGWRLTSADSEVEQYDANGSLLFINSRGSTQTLTYSDGSTPLQIAPAPGYLIAVTDHAGRSLTFEYNAAGRLIKMTDPGGGEYLYAYDEESSVLQAGEVPVGDLTSVTYPSTGTTVPKRIYHYNESAYFTPSPTNGGITFPHMLTGITGENGHRYSRYWYTTGTNRAFRSQHFGNFDRYAASFVGSSLADVTNPLGLWRRYQHVVYAGTTKIVAMYQVCQTPGCSGNVTSMFSYNADGALLYKTDFNQSRTSFTWDNVRQLETQRIEGQTSSGGTTPATRTISTQWHGTFPLPTLITEPGRTTAFAYDSNGNPLTKTVTDTALARTRIWTFTYNGFGQVLTINGPRTDISDFTTYSYDSVGNLTAITNPAGHITTISSHDGHGRPLTIVDPNGLATTLVYSPRGWITSRSVGSETTGYEYDDVGQLTKVTLPDASFLAYTYNEARRLIQIADSLGNKIVYTVDFMGNRTAEQVFDSIGSLAQTRSRAFNLFGRLVQDVGAASQTTAYGYDNHGNRTRITDAMSRVTIQTFDQLNRLTQITDPALKLTKYAFNGRDQLTSVTDPRDNATTYSVDALDNLNIQVSPDTGSTVNTYDAAGNVLTSRDAKNQTTTFVYDALNRATRATYYDGSQVAYGYDAGANGKGHLTAIVETASGGALQTQVLYAYDQKGRVTNEIRTIGSQTHVTQYGYDSAGRLNAVTYPSGTQLAYAFDSVGRVSQISAAPADGNAHTVVSGVTYHPFGGAKGFTFGNGQTYSRTFDLDGRISAFTLAGIATSLSFDAASRITAATYIAMPAQSVTFGYDNLDRLTSAVIPSTSQSFGYDFNGNRISKTVGASTKTYAYPTTNNKLTSITGGGTQTFIHDADGAVTSDGTNTFTYDTRGRLTSAQTALGTVTYGVNGLGQRYQKTLQGTTTVYLYDQRGKLIAETSDSGATFTEYVWLADTPVAVIKPTTPNQTLYFIHNDHLDTPRVLSNQAQQTVWRWNNDDPFGANMATENPSGLGTFAFNLRFPGQYFDKETNYHYNYYRDYSPEIGRYVQSDPIGLEGGINTYVYVDSEPIRLFDPLGLLEKNKPTNKNKPWLGTEFPSGTSSAGRALLCMERCIGPNSLLISGGSECTPQGTHLPGSTQGSKHCTEQAFDIPPSWVNSQGQKKVFCCARRCGVSQVLRKSNHYHFQMIEGIEGSTGLLPTNEECSTCGQND